MRMSSINNKYILIISITLILTLILVTSPISAMDIGPSHDLDRDDDNDDILEIEIEPAERNDEILSDDAAITFNISITTQNAKNTYPYIYPIDMDVIEDDEIIATQTIFLSPTLSEDYTPTYGDDDETQPNELKEEFQIYLTFDDQPGGDRNRLLSFDFNSRHTDDDITITNDYEIKGTTPKGRSTSKATISLTSGFDEPSETTHVDRFRINELELNQQFLEEFSIPYDSNYTGNIQNFQNMREISSDGGTYISSSNNGFNMVTQTRNIPRSEPQTLVITYDIFDGENIQVEPVQSNLNSIDPDTEYILPSNPDDSKHCQSISSNSICFFSLSSTEVSEINNLGELYLEYDTNGDDISAEVFCQGIISGYFSTESNTCGTDGIINSELIEVTTFEGLQLSEGDEYHSDVVPLYYDTTPRYIDVNMRAFSTTNIDDSIELKTVLVNRDDVTDNDKVDNPLVSNTFEFERGEQEILNEDAEIYTEDIIDTYVMLICQINTIGTTDCNLNNNIDSKQLDFSNRGDTQPELNIKSPISLELTEIEEQKDIIEQRIQTRTTDETYDEDSDWYYVDETTPDFVGEIEESVVVEGADSSKPNDHNTSAEGKLSDISPEGEWVIDDYNSFVSVDERYTRYESVNEDLSDIGWEATSATPERTAQLGKIQSTFDIITGSEFQSVTESERGWYLDRSGERTTRTNTQQEILHRHTDPDNCYNCLRAEKHNPEDMADGELTEAEQRFEDSPNKIISNPEGEDEWEKISDEPIIETMTEDGVNFRYRDADLDEGFSKIFDDEDTSEAVWRESEYDEREIYQWERTSETNELPFEAPDKEEISEWQYETYDIEYIYTGRIESPADLYTYQKDIYDEIITWESERVWYDFSNSEPGENGLPLNQLRFSYTGTSEVHHVDWIDGIHDKTPETIGDNLSDLCESGSADINEINGGTGGIGIIESCTIGDEEIITRVGKKYNQDGVYNPELTVYDSARNSDTDNIIVYVNEDSGTPEFVEVDSINDRVDYQIGQIAINGTITSDVSNLNDIYRIEISPADTFEGTGGCPVNYYGDMSYDIQMQTTTTDLFRQTEDCIHNAFEDPDEISSDNFPRYYELVSGDIITSDIPEGVIQNCDDDVFDNADGDYTCDIAEDEQGEDETITYKINNNYEPIDGDSLAHDYCPSGYEITEQNHENEDVESEYRCELTTDVSFSSSSRQISIDYTTIQSGVVERCENIVTSNEIDSHSGYTNEGTDGDRFCELINPSDPGPDGFEIYDSENDEFSAPPAGAIRGKRFISDENSLGNCASFGSEDGILSCEYDKGTHSNTIEYATITEGDWNFIPQNLDKVDVDRDETQNVVWESDFIKSDEEIAIGEIINPEEDFTITMNPRQIPFTESQIGEDVEFELTLKSNEGSTIQREQVEIQLCQANPVPTNNFPRTVQGENECNNFDTMLSGTDDFNSSRTTLQDARIAFEEEGETSHTITSVKNDICPYNLEYPYGQENIDGYEIEVDGTTNWQELGQELEEYIRHRYSINNPCDDDGSEINIPYSEQKQFRFNTESFRQPELTNNIRRIGVTELQQVHHDGISQSLWSTDRLGDSLRLGNPILSDKNNDLNENLVAAYTFDHGGSNDNSKDKFEGYVPPPIQNKVTDTYSTSLDDYDEYIANEFTGDNYEDDYKDHLLTKYYGATDIHHARLAFGTSCESTPVNTMTSEFSVENINCSDDVLTRDEAIEQFENDIFEGEYQNIDGQAAILSHPPREDSSPVHPDTDSYSSGLFSGNALHLDETSWLMISPPCIDRDSIGTPLSWEDGERGLDIDESNCENTGYDSLYSTEAAEPSQLISEEIMESNYTISFWVKEDSSNVARDAQQHPIRNIYSSSEPSSKYRQDLYAEQVLNTPLAHSSVELYSMDIPTNTDDQLHYPNTISQEDIDTETALETVYPTSQFIGDYDIGDFEGTWASDYIGEFGRTGESPDGVSGEDDYYLHQVSEYNTDEWNHVVLTSEYTASTDPPRTFDVFVDGYRRSSNYRFNRFGDDEDGIDPDKFAVDSGGIYEDSVLAIGAKYLDAGYAQNGEYAPQIEASAGDIKIDQLRIYDATVKEMQQLDIEEEEDSTFNCPSCSVSPELENEIDEEDLVDTQEFILSEHTEIGRTYYGVANKNGQIISDIQNVDSYQKDIEDINPLAPMEIHIDHELNGGEFTVDIIPCEDTECDVEAAATFKSTDDFDASDTARGEFTMSEDIRDYDEITGVRLAVELESNDISKSPVINEFTVTFDNIPYKTCQELALTHPSFVGNDFIAELVETVEDEDGYLQLSHYNTNCDMSTNGGGWTQFYWAEEGGTYDEETNKEDSDMSECDIEEDEVCFTSADFDVQDNIKAHLFPEHMDIEDDTIEEDTNPQILIKSITGDTTDNWVAFELVDFETDEHNEYSEYLEKYFNETVLGVDDTGLEETTDANCIYPFTSSQGYDSNQCIDTIVTQLDNIRISSSPEDVGDGLYDYIYLERDNGEIESMTCLGNTEADRCEVYYRIGSSGEYPDDINFDDE